jgi:heme-degrading monooxygenase HmoA
MFGSIARRDDSQPHPSTATTPLAPAHKNPLLRTTTRTAPNPRRIEQGEPGNLAFGVHRSVDNPNEFWLYETWASEEAVEAHESGEAFLRYKEALRPLVEADSVLFGNCVPVKVLGYRLS